MPDSQLILVTGATGTQGGAAARHLQSSGFSVRALTRDPEKPAARKLAEQGIEVVRGDLDDTESLARALQGAYGIYSVQISTRGAETEIREGKSVIDAAIRAGIRHLVYSSVAAAEQHTGIPHFDSKAVIEGYLRERGIASTVIRPVFFMENWLRMKAMIDGGAIQWPLPPETRLQMIAVDDIGAFVAMAFSDPAKWQGRAIDLAGDEFTMTGIAEAFTRASGRAVSYRQVPWEPFEQQVGEDMAIMYRWFDSTGYSIDIAAVRKLYPKLSDFPTWLKTHWPSK